MLNNDIPRAAINKCSFRVNLRFIFLNIQNIKIIIDDKKNR